MKKTMNAFSSVFYLHWFEVMDNKYVYDQSIVGKFNPMCHFGSATAASSIYVIKQRYSKLITVGKVDGFSRKNVADFSRIVIRFFGEKPNNGSIRI